MSERPITAAYKSAVGEPVVGPLWLIYMDFLNTAGAEAPVRMCSIDSGVTWDGYFWTGEQAGLIRVSDLEESSDGRAESAVVTLDAIPSVVMSAITNTQYQGRRMEIYRGVLDLSTLEVVADPELAFAGLMDEDRILDDGELSVVEISAVSRISDQLKPRVYRYTHNDQQALWPDDDDSGLEFLAQLQSVELKWGTS